MKKIVILVLGLCLNIFGPSRVSAQSGPQYQLFLKTGPAFLKNNVTDDAIRTLNRNRLQSGRKSLVLIQFDAIPDEDKKNRLKSSGIELLEYVPNNTYVASVKGTMSSPILKSCGARAVSLITPEQKISQSLREKMDFSKTQRTTGVIDVWISFPESFTAEEVKAALAEKGIEVVSEAYKKYRILALRLDTGRVQELAAMPEIKYIEPAPGPDQPVNDRSEVNSRANILRSSQLSGYNLLGRGVVVGVGDDSNPYRHIDFNNRLIHRSTVKTGSHGLHVMGTLAGAGIVNEKYRGYAPKATIVTQYFSSIFLNAAQFSSDFGMVITNNSYGVEASTCSDFGGYTLYSYILDQQAFELPYLQHVFAAGNSGSTSIVCDAGLGTVLSGYQTAKNVLTVGNTTVNGVVYSGSSKGPVKDGRTKPEISVQGTAIISSLPTDSYGSSTGTSMATPGVSGGLALLYERYRNTHSNANPKNGLMKALVCNGASDLGVSGPDFNYGFGWLNLLRSIKMLDDNRYFTDAVANNDIKNQSISIPANTAKLKVMLYWNDPAPSLFSGKNLVNNLDLTVTPSGSPAVLPRVPNSSTGATGVDDLNNMEQVVIDNPAAGSYSIAVKGKTIPQGTQEYYVVYDIIPVSTALTFPIGGERLVKGEEMYISWDANNSSSNTFKVEYSVDGGDNWTTVNAAVASTERQLSWTIPDAATDKAKVRITQGSDVKVSEAFTIMSLPVITLSSTQCEGYIAIEWTAVPGATDYELMRLRGDEMVPEATTASTSFNFTALATDSLYYVTVRPRINGNPGRAGVALSRKPDSGNCAGSISDNDLKIDRILSPASSGRRYTSTALSSSQQISIRIKNLDDVASSQQIEVGYYIGAEGSPVYKELITPTIAAGGTVDHTFAQRANLAALGSYNLTVYVSRAGDPVSGNNKSSGVFKQMDNAALTFPFFDQVEGFSNIEVIDDQVGLIGGERYDFVTSTSVGRLRTFVNTGIASSGSKAFTMDVSKYLSGGNTNYLIATYNLGSFDSAKDDIRLSFFYKNHGQLSHADNKVWIRGNDQSAWIQAYDLFANQNAAYDGYKSSGPIELSSLLNAQGQTFSSSFQIRWGQWGDIITADYSNGAGYSIDDIKLFVPANDIRMASIDSPVAVSCGLGASEQVKVTVVNNTESTISNIPIKLQFDNGTVTSKTISSIAASSSTQYTFTNTADLSAQGAHTVKVWLDLSADPNTVNNTLELAVYNSPVISSFPYLQNFETDNGSWRSGGSNSSWAYGTPLSAKILKAASGTKAWKTNLNGNYNNLETSYLYSPCFSIGSMTNPVLSFSMALDLAGCEGNVCDAAYVEYSADGNTWTRLGAKGSGTNWYTKTDAGGSDVWSVENYTRWHASTIPLPTSASTIRLRFVLQSDASTNREGIAIDDIHVYDLSNGIYGADQASTTVTQSVSTGASWVNFISGGKMIASLKPNTNNLGSTNVRANLNATAVRSYGGQYYMDRSFTIQPAGSVTSNVGVRFYFSDAEFERMVSATSCSGCTLPASVYDLSISKFSPAVSGSEDGDLTNGTQGTWSFFSAANVTKVPYDNGYYVEFQTPGFSEFWLSGGAIVVASGPLPVELVDFTAKKIGGSDAPQVKLEWVTAAEKDFSHFEIERALGTEQLKKGSFLSIGRIEGKGGSPGRYQFDDIQNTGSLTRYYRLKMVDLDGTFAYSTIRSVVIEGLTEWRVYPNPSPGKFQVEMPTDPGEVVAIHVFGPKGRTVKKSSTTTPGGIQRVVVDLSAPEMSRGLYMVEVRTGRERKTFKLIRE